MDANQYEAMLGSVYEDSEEQWGYLFQISGAPGLYQSSDLGNKYKVTIEPLDEEASPEGE